MAAFHVSSAFRWLSYKPDHVAVSVSGGLGNQLFHYAAGRALALRLGMGLRLDYPDGLDSYNQIFQLGGLRDSWKRLTPDERILWLGPGSGIDTRRRLCGWTDRLFLHRCVVEEAFRFDETVLERRLPCFLRGGWQSEDYFKDKAAEIRRDLLGMFPSCRDSPWFEKLSAPGSVALHIRRGDYLQHGVQQVMGVCPLSYYQRAAARMKERASGLHFHIFTNDPEWASQQPELSGLGPVIAPHLEEPLHDMKLMSLCHHYITANSSYSWWAAWLGQKEDSVVLCPDPWFKSAPFYQSRIVPSRWESVSMS